MKQNRPLLILLAILVAIPSAMVIPDYFSCNPLGWLTNSSAESAIETQERDDVQRAIVSTGLAAYFDAPTVDYHTLTLVLRHTPPENDKTFEAVTGPYAAWEHAYARRHGISSSPCLRVVEVDTNGRELSSSVNRDSVYRLIAGEDLW